MSKKLLVVFVTTFILSLNLAGTALAQEPSGDFEVVRQKIESWLASDPAPVTTVDAVFENLSDGDDSNNPYVLSVRSPDHYALGHVPTAENIPWRTVAKPDSLAQLPTDQPIVDYCYTGHTGQVAMTALSLMDYDVTNMKWGIMAWTKNDDVLATGRFDPASVPDYRVETEPNEATETYDFPALDTGASEDAEIVRTAIDNYLSSDKGPTISPQAVFENINDGDESNDPVILSVRSPEHYAAGHVPGAINIPWKELGKAENLAKLPADRPIVVYCYTGHTGQVASTLLNVLGYDAVNMKWGMMNWSTDPDVVATSIFDPATQADYRLEGEMAGAEPTMAEADEEEAMMEEEATMEEEAMEEEAAEEATMEEAPAEEAAPAAEEPAQLPATGAVPFDFTWIYLLVGSGLLGSGLYLRRR